MIVAADNGVMNAVDLMVDTVGIDLLIEQLTKLKADQSKRHIHIEIGLGSPLGHERVFGEIILVWIGE